MRFTRFSTMADVLESEAARQALTLRFPAIAERLRFFAGIEQTRNELFCSAGFLGVDEENMDEILVALNSARYDSTERLRSLDEIDRERYGAGPRPFDCAARSITLDACGRDPEGDIAQVLLDGVWQMKDGLLDAEAFVDASWEGCYPAEVPGSVHTALEACGKLPDSTVGVNQRLARAESYKTWWFKKEFSHPRFAGRTMIAFDGVCDRAHFYLNGVCLGGHQGMFGGPEFDVTPYLKEHNTLLVKLDPVPMIKRDPESDHIDIDNVSWRNTVVFINGYGWHYSHLQPLGIWRSVRLRQVRDVEAEPPFVFTKCAETGTVGLVLGFVHNKPERGRLCLKISPENFYGPPFYFDEEAVLSGASGQRPVRNLLMLYSKLHFEFRIPDVRLWWPVDLGEPNLYRLELEYISEGGMSLGCACVFGVRTVEMAPLDDVAQEDKYNWTFVINGEKHFVKGTGWCTMDPRMAFPVEKYKRLISLARRQHVQMLRAWGGGMPETCEFYELCDRDGIMVFQEWPTASNSHMTQPYDVMWETVVRNTLRLRNHASLVMWGAGNESSWPFGDIIDMMGRLSIELDGTRAFHRGEPWGGSRHDYNVWWGRRHLDYNLGMTADFFGEFGVCCMPSAESVVRYLPGACLDEAPPFDDGQFRYHTPVFDRRDDVSRLRQYAEYFTHDHYSFREFIYASQLSQTVAVKHTLERARTRWPLTTGALYYKLNDNFPAASWSTIDWYGVPKIGYYSVQDAFEPLSAVVLFDTVNLYGASHDLPIVLLDDANSLQSVIWSVRVRAFDGGLREIKRIEFEGFGEICPPHRIGTLQLSCEEAKTNPLFVVLEVWIDGSLKKRNFCFANFEHPKGCLFDIPQTSLSLVASADNRSVTVSNTGEVPAIMVNMECPGRLDSFMVSDNFFWLDAGEAVQLEASTIDGLRISALNSD